MKIAGNQNCTAGRLIALRGVTPKLGTTVSMSALIKLAMIAAATAIIATSTLAPASAGVSVGAFVLFSNYHTRQAAYIAVGYTTYGGTIYGDGRIIMPSGVVYYPNHYGVYPWGSYVYYSPRVVVYHYDHYRTYAWDRSGYHRGHAYGHYKKEGDWHDNGRHEGQDR